MAAVTSEMVKSLREETGAGMMDCKKALDASGGDTEKAEAWLKEKGLAAAAKKSSREASDGIVEVYSHMGGRMAVMVEVNCETDFVAKMPEFRELVHDIAIQVASTAPLYLKKEDVPADVIAAQTEKLEKFYQDTVLMEQIWVKDDKIKIVDLVKQRVAKLGENIIVRRFARFQLGEIIQGE